MFFISSSSYFSCKQIGILPKKYRSLGNSNRITHVRYGIGIEIGLDLRLDTCINLIVLEGNCEEEGGEGRAVAMGTFIQ